MKLEGCGWLCKYFALPHSTALPPLPLQSPLLPCLQTPSLPLSFSMEADLAATASMQPMQHAAQYCVPHIQGSTAVGAQSSSHTHPTLGMPPQAYHSSGMQQGSGQQYPHPMQAGSGGYKPTQAGSGGYKPTQAGSGGYPTQAGIGGYMPHQSHGGSAGAPCPPPQLQPLGRTSFRAHFEGTHYSQYATGPTGPMQPMQGSEGGQRQQRGMQEGPQPVAGLVRLADWQGVYLNTKNNKFRAYSTQSVPDGSRNKCKASGALSLGSGSKPNVWLSSALICLRDHTPVCMWHYDKLCSPIALRGFYMCTGSISVATLTARA